MADGYKGHKAGSRKEHCHKVFDERGPDTALEWGVSNGLAAGTIKSWCVSWGKGVSATARVALENGASITRTKGNIKVIWTKRPARLVARGEQQSEIKWLDTGTWQCIPNDQLKFQTSKPD